MSRVKSAIKTFFPNGGYVQYIAENLALIAVYFIVAKFGLTLAFVNASATAVWPASGFAMAVLLLLGQRFWPTIFLGAFFVNITTAGTIFTSLGIALGNTIEAIVGVYFINKFARGRNLFDRSQDVFTFSFLAGAVAPTISATIGVGSLLLAHFANAADFSAIWFTWWLGDCGGILIVMPFLVLWVNDWRLRWDAYQLAEVIFTFFLLTEISFVIFGNFVEGASHYPIALLVVPILVWIAVRFSPRETATAIILLSFIAIQGTLQDHGPFVVKEASNPNEVLLFLQAFIIVIGTTLLILAAVVLERRHIEQALRRANEVKNDFLAILAHELRNPLAPIRSYLQLIQLPEVPAIEKKEATSGIDVQLKHMTRLLDDLLDISRITKGKIRLQKEHIDIKMVIERGVESSRTFIEERRHKLILDVPKVSLWMEADSFRVEQIIVNLLNNAAKYTEPGGTISLTCRRDFGEVVIVVKDNGIGIPRDMLSHIFNMFSQVDRSANRLYGGLGIGLRLVKILVSMHGGTVVAESGGLGKGSTFSVRIPMLNSDSIYHEEYM